MTQTMTIGVSVNDMPETIYNLRKEFATMLNAEAESEGDPKIARRLREIAAAFEVGQKNETERRS